MNITVTLNNIGQIYKLQGEYDKALLMYKEAAAIQCLALRSSHLSVASTLSNVTLIYYQKGNYFKPLNTYQEAL